MSLKLIFQFLILTTVVSGVLIFFLKKILFDSTQGAVNRLNRETEMVRAKQAELNEKIKLANEELAKRRAEADALVTKMATDAEEKAKQEREKIITKARAEGEEIINKAQKTKDDMRKALEKDLDLRAIDFSVYVMNDVFSDRSASLLNECLIEEFLEGLKTVDMEMIDPKLNEAEIVLVSPLAEKYRNQLNDILQQKLGRTVQLKVVEDKKIIGGIILRFESLALDGSLRYLLKEKGADVKNKVEKGLIKV
jgi:F0F1-type ATP synthase membrane subunit b/b'